VRADPREVLTANPRSVCVRNNPAYCRGGGGGLSGFGFGGGFSFICDTSFPSNQSQEANTVRVIYPAVATGVPLGLAARAGDCGGAATGFIARTSPPHESSIFFWSIADERSASTSTMILNFITSPLVELKNRSYMTVKRFSPLFNLLLALAQGLSVRRSFVTGSMQSAPIIRAIGVAKLAIASPNTDGNLGLALHLHHTRH
jgi:hypothetical protein